MMRRIAKPGRLGAVAVAAVLASTAAVSADAKAPPLKVGVYDCMAYNPATGFLSYRGTVKLLRGSRYQYAYGRHHASLVKPHSGRYHIASGWVRFTGVLRKTPGKIKPASSSRSAFFSFYANGRSQHEACYFVVRP